MDRNSEFLSISCQSVSVCVSRHANVVFLDDNNIFDETSWVRLRRRTSDRWNTSWVTHNKIRGRAFSYLGSRDTPGGIWCSKDVQKHPTAKNWAILFQYMYKNKKNINPLMNRAWPVNLKFLFRVFFVCAITSPKNPCIYKLKILQTTARMQYQYFVTIFWHHFMRVFCYSKYTHMAVFIDDGFPI